LNTFARRVAICSRLYWKKWFFCEYVWDEMGKKRNMYGQIMYLSQSMPLT